MVILHGRLQVSPMRSYPWLIPWRLPERYLPVIIHSNGIYPVIIHFWMVYIYIYMLSWKNNPAIELSPLMDSSIDGWTIDLLAFLLATCSDGMTLHLQVGWQVRLRESSAGTRRKTDVSAKTVAGLKGNRNRRGDEQSHICRNHGCWPLIHCGNHGSTTDSLYLVDGLEMEHV